jgi:hypothetical protein
MMGPREALERIAALINAALASNDLEAVHALLQDMQAMAHRAINQRELRRGRLLNLTNRSLNSRASNGAR